MIENIMNTDKYKIALLIPCTSKGRNWSSVKETYLTNYSIKTFLLTQNKEHTYKFYIGIDEGDLIFDNQKNQDEIKRLSKVFKNVEFEFIKMENVAKGHLTKMWNILFQKLMMKNVITFFNVVMIFCL